MTIQRCESCPYGPGRAVGSRGNPEASLVIVGEAPGRQELLHSKPFVGPSGKLLHDTAKSVNLDVSNAYFTNALRCLPPDTPKRATLVCCRERLLDEINHHERKLILLMGNSALRSVTGDFQAKITKRRGIPIETKFGLALPMLHPAAILRNPADYTNFKRDMEYAAKIMDEGVSIVKRMPTPAYEIVSHGRRFGVLLRQILHEPFLSADIETTSLDWQNGSILCIGVKAPSRNRVMIFPSNVVRRKYFKKLFERYKGKWVWHNGKFDTLFLHHQLGVDARVDHDTMLMSYCLDEKPGGHGLKQLAADYLGAPTYNDDVTFDTETNELYQYLAWDVASTHGLHLLFKQKINDDPALKQLYYRLLIPASEFLRGVEQRGLYVNQEYLNELEISLTKKLAKVHEQIQEAVKPWWNPELYTQITGSSLAKSKGVFNPNSPAQLKWLIYDKSALGLNAPRGYETNTAAQTLEVLPENPITPLILESRKLTKRLGTYIQGPKEILSTSTDGRLHPSFLLHSTETGRLSSRKPNAQNFPRDADVRNIIQAPHSKKFLEVDYSQAELRVLAWISNDPFLRSVYEQDLDLHSQVAEEFFPGWSKLANDDPMKTELRVLAKSINFGILYGLGAEKLSREFNIPFDVAQMYINTLRERASKAWEFLTHCRLAARYGRTITTPFGRKRRFGPVKAENLAHLENQASNFPIQSLASDLTLIAAMRLQDAFDTNTNVVNIVHDSILVETVDAPTENLERQIIGIMESTPYVTLKVDVPFTAEIKRGYRWGDLK